jgi:succinoglycan biosynthesis protein ExoA
MGSAARVCIIMPFLNEAEHLPAVLASLAAQSYDRGRLFLVAVDNGSTDGGGRIVEAWLRDGPVAGRLLSSEVRSIPHALNHAIGCVGDDDYVVRIDAHTIYSPDYVETIMSAFDRLGPDVWCVGGAPAIAPTTEFGKALHAALFTNPMGLGPADFRSSDAVRPVRSVYLGAWRPGVLARVGGYDPRWPANEDAQLAERIRLAGGDVYRIPARSWKIITRGAGAALVQWTRYGFWRAQTFRHYPAAIRARHITPPIALLSALALLASPARLALVPLYLAYAAATVALTARSQRPLVTLATLVYFPLLHSGYALGLLTGAVVWSIPRESHDAGRAARLADAGPLEIA